MHGIAGTRALGLHWIQSRPGRLVSVLQAMFRTSERGKRMRAVDAVMECLKAEGVDVVFGLPGGANLPTYDAFVDAGIRHVLVRHEAGGGHAAEGYAKATGKVGVALGTSGPGATNLVTPIMRRDDGLGARRCSSPARCAPTCSAPTASRRPT